MKRLILILFGVFPVLLCTGCRPRTSNEITNVSHLVTEITVIRLSDLEVHCYTGQKSMGRILSYLRSLDPFGKSPGPAQATQDDYRITLTFSDGRQRTYLQKAGQFFLDGDNQWKLIHSKDAAKLPLLFAAMPSESPYDKAAIPEIRNGSF